MAPEAYTLKAAVDGWISGETGAEIRERAAAAYDKYQHCGLHAAQKLFRRVGSVLVLSGGPAREIAQMV